MKRLFILAITIATVTFSGSARRLSPQEALMRAENMSSVPTMKIMSAGGQSPKLVHTVEEADEPTVYVFNRPMSGGYLVVSADDQAGPALLGYADSGTFHADSIPENVKWWLGQYSREIASAGNRINAATDTEIEVPDVDPIAPICKTTWSQVSPFNAYCPTIDGTQCPTGCVATAMAQAMKVYNWPERGMGSHTYRPASLNEFLTVNFADSTYHWDKMLDSYSESSPQESKDAVASLMYSCGVAVSMQYHPHSAGGNYTNAARSLVKYFNYDKSLRIIGRDYYGIAEWFDMIIKELQAGHPVLYSGKNDESGHAFVCDGYRDNGYFHINWGWGGVSNGYFLLTALNPYEQGVGGSAGGFNLDQQIVIGLKRPEPGSMVVPVMQFTSNFTAASQAYNRLNPTVKMGDRRGIFNESVEELHATMGVKLTDKDGNVSYIESNSPDKKYLVGQGFTYFYIPTKSFPESGTYTVEPAVRDSVGNWFDCEVKVANDRQLNLVATADSLVFTPGKDPSAVATDVQVLSPIFPGKECCIRAIVTNKTDMEFYEEVTPILVQDHTDKGSCTPIAIELLPGESREFEWIGEFPSTLATGDYLLYLVDSNNKDLNSGIAVTVEEAPTAALQVEVESTDMNGKISTEENPCNIPLDNFKVQVHVKCLAGYFSGIVNGGVWHLNATVGIREIRGGYLAVREGEEGVVDFSADMSPYLSENVVYYFLAYSTPTGRVGNHLYFTYSPLTGIDPIGEDGSDHLSVSYDRATDQVEVRSPYTIKAAELYSASGQMLTATEAAGEMTTINAGGCAAGVYLVVVHPEQGAPEVVKILIE